MTIFRRPASANRQKQMDFLGAPALPVERAAGHDEPTPVKRHRLLAGWAIGVFAFLYLPVALLVAFSFNDARHWA